jgi:hypothetical protein
MPYWRGGSVGILLTKDTPHSSLHFTTKHNACGLEKPTLATAQTVAGMDV